MAPFRRTVLFASALVLAHAISAAAQTTTTYHLHKEASLINSANKQLKTAATDATQTALQTANLKGGLGTFTSPIANFETQTGIPGLSGAIPASSTVTFSLKMKVTSLPSSGSIYPYVELRLNSASGQILCNRGLVDGLPALTTTLQTQSFTCTTLATPISVTTADRFFLIVGVAVSGTVGNHNAFGELDIETNADGTAIVPNPAPNITSLSVSSGIVGDAVTITGTGFGASGTLTFNGISASALNWNTTTIQTSVPAGVPPGSGPVVVTVSGRSSPGATFTTIPHITSLTPAGDAIGQTVTIAGTSFGSAPGTVTFFNGVAGSTSGWADTSITVPVPAGATTGSVTVTAGGQSSNGVTFTLITTGTLVGTITHATGGAALLGATVQAVLAGVIQGTAMSAADGTYSIGNLTAGTYDVRVLATGYSSEVRSGTAISANATTNVNVAMSQPGTIAGTVTQSDGVTPIAGARVTVFSGPIQKGGTNTDSLGAYTIANLHPGAFTVQAANIGNRTKEQGEAVSENATTTSNFALDPEPAGSVLYAYDAAGRLIQVTDPSGDAAIYHYDPVGNITAIERTGASVVSISGFTPLKGPAGATVTISGTGFSTTSANTVTFGSGQVSVTAATPNQLTVSVPANATTGQIGVSNTTGSDTSDDTFAVIAAPAAPTISGFSPPIGVAGSVVTVTGTNFETTTANDRLTANLTFVSVSTASATSLTAPIPAAGSGPITVTTPAGTAVTTTDLFVAPAPYTADQVEFTQRMSIGDTLAVTINTATHIGLVTFSGTAGQRVSLIGTQGMSGFVLGCDVNVSLMTPYGARLGPVTCMEQSGFLDVQTLGVTGTYSILIAPVSPAHGSVTLTLVNVQPDFTETIVADGPAVTVSTTSAGQNGRLTFAGTAGQHISLVGTNGITGQVALTCDVNATIVSPDGTPLAGGSACMEGSGFIDPASLPPAGLPATGTYTILVDPAQAVWGNDVTLTLHTVTDFTGTVPTDGSPMAVPITTEGQNGILTFAGTASQSVSLTAGGISGQIALACDVSVSILKPDGSVLVSPTCVEGGGVINPVQLPTTGTYTVFVDPASVVKGTLTVNVTVTGLSGANATGPSSQRLSVSPGVQR